MTKECLQSLAFPEMGNRLLDIKPPIDGTCHWLPRHPKYKDWANSYRGLLWIKGHPGSGKSTLLRYMLKTKLSASSVGANTLVLHYFSHGRGTDLQKTPAGLFRTLLHQLLRKAANPWTDLLEAFRTYCRAYGEPGQDWHWHTSELQEFFERRLARVLETNTVWLLLDALDECGEEAAFNIASGFGTLLENLPHEGLKPCHICFTCRHYPIPHLGDAFQICVEQENKEDISTFVRSKLAPLNLTISSNVAGMITTLAQGSFLWAWLVVQKCRDLARTGFLAPGIEEKLKSVPLELNDLYQGLIRDLSSDSLKLFELLCFSERPLSLREWRWAMAIEIDCPHESLEECKRAGNHTSDDDQLERQVRTLSRGLAEITPSKEDRESLMVARREEASTSDDSVVQFIHHSVKEFFRGKAQSPQDGHQSIPGFVAEKAHDRLFKMCIRYLTMDEKIVLGAASRDELEALSNNFPFLHYATTFWVAHMKQAYATDAHGDELCEWLTRLSPTVLERWGEYHRALNSASRSSPASGLSLVAIMSKYDALGPLQIVLTRRDQFPLSIDAKDSDDMTPLLWASELGHQTIVQLLLNNGAHVDAAKNSGDTPLLWAAAAGHEATVRLLLASRARVGAANRHGETPLYWAAKLGHEEIVRLLLDEGADVDARTTEGETPLHAAVQHKHEAIARLLLMKGANIEAKGRNGMTPLVQAADAIYVISLLPPRLNFKPDGDANNFNRPRFQRKAVLQQYCHCLYEFIESSKRDFTCQKHQAIMRLLLEKGANIEAKGRSGGTPLLLSVCNGRKAFVQLLLEHHADIEARVGENGPTALALAMKKGYASIERLLRDQGARTY